MKEYELLNEFNLVLYKLSKLMYIVQVKKSICCGTFPPCILDLHHKLQVPQPQSSSQIQIMTLKFTENGIYFIINQSESYYCLVMMPLPPPSPWPASLLRSNLSMSKASTSTLTLASKGFWKLNVIMAASGLSLWYHPGQSSPYCPTDHGKDLEGIIILINPEAMPLKATSKNHTLQAKPLLSY